MSHSYTRGELTEYFFDALDIFSERLDSDISKDNLVLDFFTPENGVEVYENFCRAHFPKMLDEPFRKEGYFNSIGAQAFENEKVYGVLIREDIDFTLGEILQMFLHEISHLFCMRNEVEGGNFFDKYCIGSGPEDGMMNAGYAIWREAVADIMADSIISESAQITLKNQYLRREIESLYNSLSVSNPDSKKAVSLIIVYTMISRESACTENWGKAEKAIKQNIKIEDPLLFSLIEQVFRKLNRHPFWEITPDFIMTLGETYVSLISHKLLRDIKGYPELRQ